MQTFNSHDICRGVGERGSHWKDPGMLSRMAFTINPRLSAL